MEKELFYGDTRDPVAPIGLTLRRICRGLPTRMAFGMSGQVAFTGNKFMNIYQNPGFNQVIIVRIVEGTHITIINGPLCTDDATWWKIQTDKKVEGWMVESQNGIYLIEPVR
jgi:hypothetical protein